MHTHFAHNTLIDMSIPLSFQQNSSIIYSNVLTSFPPFRFDYYCSALNHIVSSIELWTKICVCTLYVYGSGWLLLHKGLVLTIDLGSIWPFSNTFKWLYIKFYHIGGGSNWTKASSAAPTAQPWNYLIYNLYKSDFMGHRTKMRTKNVCPKFCSSGKPVDCPFSKLVFIISCWTFVCYFADVFTPIHMHIMWYFSLCDNIIASNPCSR